jgi:hypothetical protein
MKKRLKESGCRLFLKKWLLRFLDDPLLKNILKLDPKFLKISVEDRYLILISALVAACVLETALQKPSKWWMLKERKDHCFILTFAFSATSVPKVAPEMR